MSGLMGSLQALEEAATSAAIAAADVPPALAAVRKALEAGANQARAPLLPLPCVLLRPCARNFAMRGRWLARIAGRRAPVAFPACWATSGVRACILALGWGAASLQAVTGRPAPAACALGRRDSTLRAARARKRSRGRRRLRPGARARRPCSAPRPSWACCRRSWPPRSATRARPSARHAPHPLPPGHALGLQGCKQETRTAHAFVGL